MTVAWRKLKNEIIETLSGYDNVFVMVSGGVDSIVLLDMVSRLKDNVNVIHFRHLIRDTDYLDASLVMNMAFERNLPFFIGYGEGLSEISNQENAAREQRWKFAQDVVSSFSGKSIVLTAHHYNDNLEQYFMASMRGSNNLVMKKLVDAGSFTKYKPFLNIEKKELIETAKDRKLSWIEDVTNSMCDHERNIVRNKIIPEMMNIRNIKKSMRPLIERLMEE